MGDEPLDEDPGWPPLQQTLLFLVPGYLQLTRKRRGDPLLMLRAVFVSFSTSLVLFGVVLTFLGTSGPTHVMPWLAILAAAGVVTTVAVGFLQKPLDCSSEERLGGSYRSRFFLVMAFSQSVALVGFVFAFDGAPTWVYDVAAVFAIARMWTVDPPTPRRLQQHQAALTEAGCTLSLVGALRRTNPPRR